MEKTYIEMIGLIAGACTTLSFVPQIYRVIKSHSTKDISVGMYVLFCSGVGLWVCYGVLSHSLAVVVANALTFVLAGMVLYMKLRDTEQGS